jgi:hypothetical protein
MKTQYGYKLMEMDTEGNLYPLFLDKDTAYPLDKWIDAEIHYSKNFAPRPGIHCGIIPAAPWLMSYGSDGNGYYKGRRKGWKRVFVEVEYNTTINYNDIVAKLKKRCFEDKIPENGWYFFKEYGKATWIITDKIKIHRVITEEERQIILKEAGYDEVAAFAPYKAGFEKKMKVKAS